MQKIFSKKLLFLIPIFVFLGLFLFGTHPAKAFLGLEQVAADILIGVFYILRHFGGLFAGFCGNLFTIATRFGFDNMDVVNIGWTITKDIVNMFFILGLVVIAFATILRIETYGMKALLPKFIVVALLINFSYLICGIIVDASQVVVNNFIAVINRSNAGAEVDIGIGLLDSLQVQNSLTGGLEETVPIQTEEETKFIALITEGFDAAILFIAGFVLLVGTILLFLRIGAIWVLIILAPFAWFFQIFPGKLQQYGSKWWDEFLKWVFFAPVYIFFIYLVLKLSQFTRENTQNIFSNIPQPTPIVSSMILSPTFQNIGFLFQYVFLVVLLLGAPTVAMSMGIKAAGAAQTFVKGGLRLAYKIPGRLRAGMIAPPGWMKAIPGVRKVATGLSFVAKWTTPEIWKKAIEARKVERMREARVGRQIGRQQDVMNRVLSLWTRRTTHAEGAEQFEVDEKKKEIAFETKRVGSRLITRMKEAFRQKDLVAYKASMELLQEQGDTNDVMNSSDFFDDFEYDEKLLSPKLKAKLKGKKINDPKKRRFSNLGFKHGIIQSMRKMGENDKNIAAFLGKMQDIGLNTGYFGLYGMATVDDKGELVIADDQKHIDTAVYKYKVMTPRMRTSKLHTTSFMKQGAAADHYTFEDWDEVGEALLESGTSEGDVAKTNTEYVRPDTRDAYADGYVNKNAELKKLGRAAYMLGFKCHHFKTTGKDPTPQEINAALAAAGFPTIP